jgi:hypothetical protein
MKAELIKRQQHGAIINSNFAVEKSNVTLAALRKV